MGRCTDDLDNILSSPKRAIFSMSVPLFLSMLIAFLQSFVDGLWCSGLGADEMSAISIAAPVYTLIAAIGSGFGIGASASIARHLGAGDREKAETAASTTIALTLVISIAISAILLFLAEPLIVLSGGGNHVDMCMDYTVPFLLCSFFIMMNGIWAALLRAEGASRKSMILSLIASALNIVLDPVFIYVLDMGVLGASVATCISFIAITVIGFRWYLAGKPYIRLSPRKVSFRRAALVDLAVVGVPCTVEMMLVSLMTIPQQALVVSCGGSDGLVVYIYAFNFVTLAMIPARAIAKSLVPIVSAAIGQRDSGKIAECVRITYRLIIAMEAAFNLLIFAAAEFLAAAFVNSESMEALHAELTHAMRIYSLTCILRPLWDVSISVLQAIRHAFLATALTFTREFSFIVLYFFAATVSMDAIYWSLVLVNVFATPAITVLMFRLLKGTYRTLDTEPVPSGVAS
ncbi:MAG: MATE family efflux transporter [Thermoplasmata archaeon]|nr:MATE family efflux transporter [Thermoplasmata archaeon]